jgi:hypothetical protein
MPRYPTMWGWRSFDTTSISLEKEARARAVLEDEDADDDDDDDDDKGTVRRFRAISSPVVELEAR